MTQATEPVRGKCLCGAVAFVVDTALTSPRFCHCENCRKFAGTTPAAWAMATRSSMHIEANAQIGRYDSGAGIRCFCNVCGSPVWFESKAYPDIVGIPLGAIDSGAVPAPEVRLWTSSRMPWECSTTALP